MTGAEPFRVRRAGHDEDASSLSGLRGSQAVVNAWTSWHYRPMAYELSSPSVAPPPYTAQAHAGRRKFVQLGWAGPA